MKKKLKICSVILAREGSKGIPNKNLKLIKNKPMIYYSINASLKSKVDETWVSSDSKKILKIAKKFGSKILLRPKKLAKDKSKSEDALIHFAENILFDILVFIQPTSPLISYKDINQGLKLLKDFNSVLTVSKINQFIWFDKNPTYDIKDRKRRQDTNKNTYIETGSLFITTRKRLLKYKNRLSGKIGFIEIERKRSFDVDNYEDLDLIKKIIR